MGTTEGGEGTITDGTAEVTPSGTLPERHPGKICRRLHLDDAEPILTVEVSRDGWMRARQISTEEGKPKERVLRRTAMAIR